MATLEDLVRQAVDAYLSGSQMSERKLGAFAVGDPSMVPRFMAGGSTRLDKADQLLCYMGQAPIGPGFVSEVEAFLSDTGIGHRSFGSDAAGDPFFVRKLKSGESPLLSTVEQVQAWMRANRSVFEPTPGAQGQDDGQQSLPDGSSDPDHHEEPAEALTDPPPPDDVRPRGTTVYTKDGPQVILTTREGRGPAHALAQHAAAISGEGWRTSLPPDRGDGALCARGPAGVGVDDAQGRDTRGVGRCRSNLSSVPAW